MSEDLKTMKAPTVEVRLEKRYVVSVAGVQLGSFREVASMCNMKHLTGPEGVLVIDSPSALDELFRNFLTHGESEPFHASVIKASPDIIQKMREAIDVAKERVKGVEGEVGPGPCPSGDGAPAERIPVEPKEEDGQASEESG